MGEGVAEIHLPDFFRLWKPFPGGELGAIIQDANLQSQKRPHRAEGLSQVPRPNDHKVPWGVMKLQVDLDLPAVVEIQPMDAGKDLPAPGQPFLRQMDGRGVGSRVREGPHEFVFHEEDSLPDPGGIRMGDHDQDGGMLTVLHGVEEVACGLGDCEGAGTRHVRVLSKNASGIPPECRYR